MHTREVIEEIISSAFDGLCSNCLHANTCVFHKTSTKKIIQCELYVFDLENGSDAYQPKGLCKNCELASACTLPGRSVGVWHCNEYR